MAKNSSGLISVECFPLPRQRRLNQSNNFQTYCVKFQNIDGLHQVDTGIDCYHLQANLFDQTFKQFVGSTWIGRTVHIKDKKISHNQNFYFYTSIFGKELLLIIEVVTKSKVPGKVKIAGWISIPLFENSEDLKTAVQYKVPLINGSPLVLYFLNERKKNINLSQKTTGMEISFTLSSCSLLMRLVHLIPENVLFGASDCIPGLVAEPVERANESGYVYKPKLQKCSTYLLEKLSVKVCPTIEIAESEILKKLQEEHLISDSSNQTAREPVIIHRRLQVGVYNGFCFIHEPDIYHLLVEPVVTPTGYQPNRRSSSMGSLNFSREECLILRSDIKIPNVPEDPNISFIFLLEYSVIFQSSQNDKLQLSSSVSKNPASNIAIAWGFCKLGNLKTNPCLKIQLTSDPSSCPFKILLLNISHKFEISLSIVPYTKQNRYSSPHLDKMSTSTFSNDSPSTVRPSNVHHSPTNHSVTKQKSLSDIPMNLQQNEYGASKPRQGVSVRDLKDSETNAALQEVALIPTSMPLVPPSLLSSSYGCRNKGGSYSKSNWEKLQPIFDHHGQPATMIDSTVHYNVDKNKELQGPPQINECIFQFLALSGLENNIQIPNQIFITFQFYRFPSIKSESLELKPNSSDGASFASRTSLVYALYSSQDKRETAGYQVTYNLNPSELEDGEYKPFLLFLAKENMHLDIWDSQSSLYFGTVIIPLKYFCRQGKEAVYAVLELDIIKCEFLDDTLSQTPVPSNVSKGKFHIRVANIRHPLPPKSLKILEEHQNDDSVIICAKRKSLGSSMTSSVVTHAKPVTQTNRELSKLLASRCTLNDTQIIHDPNLSEERRRKLARMEAVRNMENDNETSYKFSKGIQSFIKERQRDLLSIDSYMKKNKPEMIHTLLHSSITTEKVIYPITGTTTFFEFEVENPYQITKSVEISWKCTEISLITDVKKWQYFRTMNNMSQKVESRVFSSNNEISSVILQPREKLNVPFTYHCMSSVTSLLDSFKAASGHHFSAGMLSSAPISNNLCSILTKIYFKTEDQTLIAVLNLKIQPIPTSFSHVFKFLTLEHSMFKKSIKLRSESGANTKYTIECSDPEVICSLQDSHEWGGGVNMHLKAPTHAPGSSREFYLFIYSDIYQVCPFQTWIVSVHPQQRIDLSCVAGQTMRTSLIIRGRHVTNLVKCFSSSPELQLHPSDPFILSAFTVQELAIHVRCLVPGTKHFQITMVSQSSEHILQSWLLVLSCQKPSVSKAFQVHLSMGKESTKRITYTNTSNQNQRYVVYSSHPHLLHLREYHLNIESGKSYCLGLYFPPLETVFTDTIFLYLNDADDKNQETYCIKVICQ